MSNAIKVKSLSKKYMIGERAENLNLREKLHQRVLSIFKRKEERKINSNEFWALRDINFEIKHGEKVGIIGRNGAGKSTLLKLLGRITTPTLGEIHIDGKIASLLEVGTGFHPELTGRENIFLNGSILGMSRSEIKRKFDEIVHFSEVEKFLDTPVKRYSSGMYVRLAFAVASCLDSDILVVDEVLAVGDAQFQKKCLGKMNEIGSSGRTVILVSHNMDVIRSMANKILYLDKGELKFDGNLDAGIALYSQSREFCSAYVDLKSGDFDRYGTREFSSLNFIELSNKTGNQVSEFEFGEDIKFKIGFELFKKFNNPEIGICINTSKGGRLHHIVSNWYNDFGIINPGGHTVLVEVPNIKLYPGNYYVTVWIRPFGTMSSDDYIENAVSFKINSSKELRLIDFSNYSSGGVFTTSEWKINS